MEIRQCAVQHPWDRSASARVAPATWHSSRSTSSGSIKASTSLSQNNFAKFLASTLTRMILRSFHSSLIWIGSFIFGRATRDIFIEIRGASVFIYRDIRSDISFTFWRLLQMLVEINYVISWCSYCYCLAIPSGN